MEFLTGMKVIYLATCWLQAIFSLLTMMKDEEYLNRLYLESALRHIDYNEITGRTSGHLL